MLLSVQDLPDIVDDIDLCIVGGGAAGLTLAHEFIGSNLRIVVLEAGGLKRTAASQAFFRGEVADLKVHGPTDFYRVRALGGASRIWGGRCLPFDPIDFQARPWVPMSGWPFPYADILPYYERAHVAAEVGDFDYTAKAPLAPGLDSDRLQTTLERFSRPTNFWTRFGEALTAAPNIRVVLEAATTAVRLTPNAALVDHLEIAAPDGARKTVRAAHYVVALGGMETPRLLLASADVRPAGVGNDHDWLGRTYMCHIAATVGMATFSGPPQSIGFDYERDHDGIYLRRRIWVTEKAQRERQIMNMAFRLHIAEAIDPAHGDPILSAMYLAKNFTKYEYSRKARENPLPLRQELAHIGNVARRPFRLVNFATRWIHKRYLSDRRIPSVALFSPQNRYPLEFHGEQAPNRNSRITLGAERDPFGMRRIHLDWRVTPLDIDTVRQSYRLLASEMERTEVGRLDFDEATLEVQVMEAGAYGGHHIGAARMSARPEEGVVDPNCRVHGVANLHVASAATMPTSGQANPTLTVIALAIRLADRLKAELRTGALRETA